MIKMFDNLMVTNNYIELFANDNIVNTIKNDDFEFAKNVINVIMVFSDSFNYFMDKYNINSGEYIILMYDDNLTVFHFKKNRDFAVYNLYMDETGKLYLIDSWKYISKHYIINELFYVIENMETAKNIYNCFNLNGGKYINQIVQKNIL